MGWKIAALVLVVSTVGALAWGLVRGNDLQNQVDPLSATVAEQQTNGQATATGSEAEITDLGKQVATFEASSKSLEKQSAAACRRPQSNAISCKPRCSPAKRM
jgi:hypothetical protein